MSKPAQAQAIARTLLARAAPTVAGYVGDVVLSKRYDYQLYTKRLDQLKTLLTYCDTNQQSFESEPARTIIPQVVEQAKDLPNKKDGAQIIIDMHSAAWYTSIVNALIGDIGIALQLRSHPS